jgi:hypothetical protein
LKELSKEETAFGRKTDCDVNLSEAQSELVVSSAYSNVHFIIKKVAQLFSDIRFINFK